MDLWHGCHSWLLATAESSQRFAIPELDNLLPPSLIPEAVWKLLRVLGRKTTQRENPTNSETHSEDKRTTRKSPLNEGGQRRYRGTQLALPLHFLLQLQGAQRLVTAEKQWTTEGHQEWGGRGRSGGEWPFHSFPRGAFLGSSSDQWSLQLAVSSGDTGCGPSGSASSSSGVSPFSLETTPRFPAPGWHKREDEGHG